LYLKKNQNYLEQYQRFCIKAAANQYRPSWGTLLDFHLKNKGYLLQNSQKMRRRILEEGSDRLKTQFAQWEKLKNQIARAYNLSQEDRAKEKIDLPTWESELNALEKTLRRDSQAFSQAIPNQTHSWRNVQSQLKGQEAALDMVRLGDDEGKVKYLALIFTKTQENPDILLWENGDRLENQDFQIYQQALKTTSDAYDQAYQSYWQPIADYCRKMGIRKLFFSADGVYHQIATRALRNPETGQYVLEELELIRLAHLWDLMPPASPEDHQNIGPFVLLGNPRFRLSEQDFQSQQVAARDQGGFRSALGGGPIDKMNWPALPATQVEVQEIARLLRAPDRDIVLLTREKAQEFPLKSLHNPRVLHLASHGFFSKSKERNTSFISPLLRSGIVLAGVENYFQAEEKPRGEDGILSALEASTLHLDETELVVLSACETAQGKIVNGEGVF
ncbi:MAG: CHAT domain-containing protein, partial [Bacteroidota bacterium]